MLRSIFQLSSFFQKFANHKFLLIEKMPIYKLIWKLLIFLILKFYYVNQIKNLIRFIWNIIISFITFLISQDNAIINWIKSLLILKQFNCQICLLYSYTQEVKLSHLANKAIRNYSNFFNFGVCHVWQIIISL